jgi:PemK-like, MazF-like toxin of type II toxin-antitoxin system
MLTAGDVVVVDFPGAVATKRRPAVVLSTPLYHANRPDVIVGLLTTNTAVATAPTDYILQDWSAAGLHRPSAFRSYILTLDDGNLPAVGHLSDRDWQGVQECLVRALAVPATPTP